MRQRPDSHLAKILIVDDNRDNLFTMTQVLHSLDGHILTADSGEQALSLMLRHTFAVVLMDVQMPGMNGFETAALMREHEETRTTPIIFVTAMNKEPQNVFRGYEAGAVDFLFKPVDPVILRSKVRIFLELWRQRAELDATVLELERSNDDLDRFAHALRGLVDHQCEQSPADGRPTSRLHPEEMVRRVQEFLDHRHCANADPGRADLRVDDDIDDIDVFDDARTARVSFLDQAYRVLGDRAAIMQTLLSSMEEVVILGKQIEQTNEHLRREVAERQRAERASRAASEAKSRLLGNVSHELRTPLNGILGFSELLSAEIASGRLAARYGEPIELISQSGKFLLKMVDELLARSRLELGPVTLDEEPIDMFAFIGQVAAALQPLAEKRANILRWQCDGDIGQVRTDRTKLQQILHNLLANACKFTRDGDICISATRQNIDGIPMVSVSVRDTGIGIAPEHQAEIFEDFKQLNGHHNRSHGGVGLGLAICKRYCELMGASLTVDSTPGTGSVFTVTLKAYPAATRPAAPAGG